MHIVFQRFFTSEILNESVAVFVLETLQVSDCLALSDSAGLQYAAPCETLDQMVLLRTVLNFSVLSNFPCFRIVGFSSRTCRASAFLPDLFQ